MIRFIGDIHGMIGRYAKIAMTAERSVQIGDFGYGWFNRTEEQNLDDFFRSGKHRFIRGNHDSPERACLAEGFIEDGTFDEDDGIMYVGGAMSVDWAGRVPGQSWWFDEQLSDEEFEMVYDKYVAIKPEIMVTHDAPNNCIHDSFKFPNAYGYFRPTRTTEALQRMLDVHAPKLWLFGHWHEHVDNVLDGTRFICLAELQSADVDPHTLEVTY